MWKPRFGWCLLVFVLSSLGRTRSQLVLLVLLPHSIDYITCGLSLCYSLAACSACSAECRRFAHLRSLAGFADESDARRPCLADAALVHSEAHLIVHAPPSCIP
ncbi:BQ5605_C015g07937 [Microbotryum silenes-dioicae]|uniref:BQ5605_C015g07937 protein n=1 Tax=Microbotryum silenes-dioicae TaxID=796604 RepID=A0A2X0LXW0_9BASI|nr:BQ5605_C015g07937 [Microbotryum silenes-dioicae]